MQTQPFFGRFCVVFLLRRRAFFAIIVSESRGQKPTRKTKMTTFEKTLRTKVDIIVKTIQDAIDKSTGAETVHMDLQIAPFSGRLATAGIFLNETPSRRTRLEFSTRNQKFNSASNAATIAEKLIQNAVNIHGKYFAA